MNKIQVNVFTKVNSAKIRREQHNGREHLVLPSYTLPANVIMNGGLYPASEIDEHYQKLEGTLAPLGHPTMDGEFISAFSPEGLNQGHIGAWNRNVKKAGNRVYVEKWVDIEVAQRSEGGRELLERVEAIVNGEDVPPIHTSVAVFLEQIEANQEQRDQGAQWVAKIHDFDHDAILLNEPGAATPEQGVGLLVNANQATPLIVHSGVLAGESFRDKERRLDQAVRDQLRGSADYAYVADFTDSQVIVVTDADAKVYDYTIEDNQIKFDLQGVPVERRESWVTVAANKLKQFFTPNQARPEQPEVEGNMPLTPEEKAELLKDFGGVVAEALKPNQEAVSALVSRMDKLEANSQQAEEAVLKTKRAEAAKVVGEVVANQLNAEGCDAVIASSAAQLAGNYAGAEQDSLADVDFNKHFGG